MRLARLKILQVGASGGDATQSQECCKPTPGVAPACPAPPEHFALGSKPAEALLWLGATKFKNRNHNRRPYKTPLSGAGCRVAEAETRTGPKGRNFCDNGSRQAGKPEPPPA